MMTNVFGIIPLFFGKLGITEILIILIIVLLLFGGKKIPELMRGIGKGIKEFKDGINDDTQDSSKSKKEEIK